MATNDTKPPPSVCLEDTEEMKKVFNKFDSNGDGKISATELVEVLKSLGSDTSVDEVNRMMDEMDTDRDGFINLEEFTGFCKAGSAYGDGGETELKEAFHLYDQDNDGKISVEELHKILTRLGEKCTIQDCTRMIDSVDSNGDGFVNFEEFKKMMTNNKTETPAP
ncbi:hypothetical protein LguiA_009269 [Lonicera macranthoides]